MNVLESVWMYLTTLRNTNLLHPNGDPKGYSVVPRSSACVVTVIIKSGSMTKRAHASSRQLMGTAVRRHKAQNPKNKF